MNDSNDSRFCAPEKGWGGAGAKKAGSSNSNRLRAKNSITPQTGIGIVRAQSSKSVALLLERNRLRTAPEKTAMYDRPRVTRYALQ